MGKFGKNIFGKGLNLKAEVTNGDCPLCHSSTIFVSIYHNLYRCMACGGDTEQKVNGVISYMPAAMSGIGPTPVMELEPDEPKA
jgi:ssDNA-binding Zn-finger/Zn-ribbon topoisomerase 1